MDSAELGDDRVCAVQAAVGCSRLVREAGARCRRTVASRHRLRRAATHSIRLWKKEHARIAGAIRGLFEVGIFRGFRVRLENQHKKFSKRKKGTPRLRVPFLIALVFRLDLLIKLLPSSGGPGSIHGKIPGGLALAGREPWFPSRTASRWSLFLRAGRNPRRRLRRLPPVSPCSL